MKPLELASTELLGFEEELETLLLEPIRVSGVTESFAIVIAQRLRSTYSAMSLLLRTGQHDEAVVLMRRQLEDSLRLHYLVEHHDRADGFILTFQRDRELKVQKRLDRVLNHPDTPLEQKKQLGKMANLRRQRVRDIEEQMRDLDLQLDHFPRLEDMLPVLGRTLDAVPYASAAEVSHSAISAATDAYVELQAHDASLRRVGLRSEGASDRLGYARAVVNTTAMALYHAFRLLGEADVANRIVLHATPRIERLSAAQEAVQSAGSDK